MMTTRDEFVDLVNALEDAALEADRFEPETYHDRLAIHVRCEEDIMDTFDAQAACIAELEAEAEQLQDEYEAAAMSYGSCARELLDATEHIAELEAALVEKDVAYAEAWALVLSHEGHIEKLNASIAELEARIAEIGLDLKEMANDLFNADLNCRDAGRELLKIKDGERYI